VDSRFSTAERQAWRLECFTAAAATSAPQRATRRRACASNNASAAIPLDAAGYRCEMLLS